VKKAERDPQSKWLTFHFCRHSEVNYQLLLSLLACALGILWSVHPGMSGLQLDMTYEIHNIMHLLFTVYPEILAGIKFGG
jgi:hypothetical protein